MLGKNLSVLLLSISFFLVSSASGTVLYVDDDAPAGGNGGSWGTAYQYLQDALAAAVSGDEIRVAQGTYKPDQGAGQTAGNQHATFQMKNAVQLYGGYAGITGTIPASRDVELFETILSGEIGGASQTDNIIHVVTSAGTDSSALIDGFTISDGYATGGIYWIPETNRGAGMYINGGELRINNCLFYNNISLFGGGVFNKGNSKFEHCRFMNNTASPYVSSALGGGLFNAEGNPIISNCIFKNNTADWGGGICNGDNCFPSIIDCLFIGNTAKENGGGICNKSGNNPIIINCLFLGNMAKYGGGQYDIQTCNSIIVGSVFSGNTSNRWGGGIYSRGTPQISHCTIVNNSAVEKGGGVYFNDHYVTMGNPLLTNCILWGNAEPSGLYESTQIHGGDPILNYCCVQGWSGYLQGSGNFGVDPLFIDADGLDNIAGTEDDDLRLSTYSPCIDAGNSDAISEDIGDIDHDGNTTEPLPFDLNGSPRIVDIPWVANTGSGTPPGLDMGAYETGMISSFIINKQKIVLPEGNQDTFTVALASDPGEEVTVQVINASGDSDIVILSGSVLTFNSLNYMNPQTVTLEALEDSDNLDGQASILISSVGYESYKLTVWEQDNDDPIRIYVDSKAAGANNGSDWMNAFKYLQDGLSAARLVGQNVEIRVAQGIYQPDKGNGFTPGDRNASFELINHLAIRGGYAGNSYLNPDARNIFQYPTVLSGDLNGDDQYYHNSDLSSIIHNEENSYHVVFSTANGSPVILNGLFITRGYASGDRNGGGVYSDNSCLNFEYCTFLYNFTDNRGGGFYSKYGKLEFHCCQFMENEAVYSGGGVYTLWSNVQCGNCRFIANKTTAYSDGGGGAVTNFSFSYFNNCRFDSNQSRGGSGGLGMNNGDITVENSIFSKNTANGSGGGAGIGNNECNLRIRNSHFEGNSLWGNTGEGGGLYIGAGYGITHLHNCVFSQNSAGGGGGIAFYNRSSDSIRIENCVLHNNLATGTGGGISNESSGPMAITNSIFWDNSSSVGSELRIRGGAGLILNISCSDIKGGISSISDELGSTIIWGEGNIDVDPGFTVDYHLRKGSACINAGDPAYAVGNDADMDGEPRVYGGRIDIGADEWIDSDDDGLADWYESRFYGSAIAALPDADDDTDGKINLEEYYRSTNPVGPYYVSMDGKCEWDGLAASWDGVHGPKRLIQSAIDTAYSGDQIQVSPGTYLERIDLGGKDLVLRSNQPEIASCVVGTKIEADRSGPVVKFSGTETPACLIDGFTITGGGNNFAGGGIDGNYASPTHATIRRCVLTGNEADWGGGIGGGDGFIEHCRIIGNTAKYGGGGIAGCNGVIKNCVIAKNTAADSGGGMQSCDAGVQFCTIADNVVTNGTEGAKLGGAMYYCKTANIQNSILWGNSLPSMQEAPSPTYSCVQGGIAGLGNLDIDPLFADPVNGDYHLKSAAGRWDPASQGWVMDSVTSSCIDAGNPGTPLGEEPVDGNNVRVNLGAYGGTAEASKTPSGWSLLSDATNDGTVNDQDLQIVRTQWLQSGSENSADFNRDGCVNTMDLLLLRKQWMQSVTR